MSRTDVWLFVAPPLLWLMLDRLAMGLMGDHLFSMRALAALGILPGMIAEATSGFWKTLAVEVSIWLLICSVLSWIAGRIKSNQLSRKYLAAGTVLVWCFVLLPSIFNWDDPTSASQSPSGEIAIPSDAREERIRRIGFAQVHNVPEKLPDVVIIVLESFRPELVDVEVMPNLAAAADQGLWCKQHFSSGNATSHGMFSIVTGMDATWFDTSLRYQPSMYRLFRSAGYELGFFAGHDDWRKFYMDGFVSSDHFDTFEIMPQDRLESDRRAIQSMTKFLEPEETRAPRLAILYLYVTHAPYRSYAQDRVFSPAAKDGFLIPYSNDQVSKVWNRYKNSAVTADRWIGSILSSSSDRLVLVTGDHGEAFLEDGTIGHGTKISIQQNSTPAILIGSGIPHREIDAPTIHSDLLLTLLSATGIGLSDPSRQVDAIEDDAGTSLFDGSDLLNTSEETLLQRTNVTRDYLTDDVQLITDFEFLPRP